MDEQSVNAKEAASEQTQPEKAQPGKAPPKKTQPKKAQPEKAQPEKAQPEKAQPEKAQPEKTQPEKAPPKKAQPEKVQPEKAQSEKTLPEKAQSEKTLPEKAQPEKALPEKAQPEKAPPKKVQPEKTQPEKALPEKAQPEKAQPEKAQPEKVQAEKPQPKRAQPKKAQSEKTQPEKEQSEKEQPEKTRTEAAQASEVSQTRTVKVPYRRAAPPPEERRWRQARRGEFLELVWRPWLSPVAALAAVCLAISLLLGLTNMVTAPVIAENARAAADAARIELLPGAAEFEQLPMPDGAPENVTAVYAANGGLGYIVEAYGQGYGGRVPVMVAFGPDGSVAGVDFLANGETPGLGQNLVTDGAFGAQFTGMPAQPIALSGIDTLANATISSNAALTAINAAIEAYSAAAGGALPKTPGEAAAALLPGETLTPIEISADGVLPTAYAGSAGSFVIVGTAAGFVSDVTVAVAVGADGVVLNIWIDASGERNASTLGNNAEYAQSFAGQTAPVTVDIIAGATGTSTGVNTAVNNALAALAAAKEAV